MCISMTNVNKRKCSLKIKKGHFLLECSNSFFRWLDLLKRVSEWMDDCFAEKYLIDSEGDILDEDYAKVYKKDILNQERWKSLWTDTTDKKCLAHAIIYQLLQKV